MIGFLVRDVENASEKEMKQLYDGIGLPHHTYVTSINQTGVEITA